MLLRLTDLMLISVACCFSSFYFTWNFNMDTILWLTLILLLLLVLVLLCIGLPTYRCNQWWRRRWWWWCAFTCVPFANVKPNQSEHNIIIFQILVVLFCLWLCHEHLLRLLTAGCCCGCCASSLHLPFQWQTNALGRFRMNVCMVYQLEIDLTLQVALANVFTKLPFKQTCRRN